MNALKPVKNHKGGVLVMMAISLFVLIASVGLAIDSGLGYIIKAKLNAAVDAAGIAASRAVSQGQDQNAQISNATQAANRFFHANYPNGFLNSTPNPLEPLNDPVVTVTFGQPGTTDHGKVFIDISANAVVPVTFMRVMNFNLLSVSAVSQVVRKDLDMAFVVDTSASLLPVDTQVKSAAKSFLDFLNPTTDRVALMHFSYGGVVDDPISPVNRGFNRDLMKTHIDNLNFGGATNYSEGMWNARDQLNNKITPVNRSSLRVIVFFSDGAPNTFASFFAFKSNSCTQAGSIFTGEGATGTPNGLYAFDRQNQQLTGGNLPCYPGTGISSALTATALPAWYNAHDVNDQEFPVVTNTPRVVANNTSSTANTYNNVNRAARNLGESMAAKSRSEGIYVFTLGLGANLAGPTGPDGEHGDIVLKCMANVPDVPAGTGCPRYDPNSLQGVFCHAQTIDELKPCFATLASEISRLTK